MTWKREKLTDGLYRYRGATIERADRVDAERGRRSEWHVTYPGAATADDVAPSLRTAIAWVDLALGETIR